MQVKEKHLVIIIFAVVIAVGGYMWFKKTAPERKYKAEIKQLKMISEHQGLEIKVMKQNKELTTLKAEIEKKRPSYKLTPEEPNK